ncbi:MAG: hypothetical protein SGILL_010889, partial [Bacillariaceae sp.]
PHNKRLEGVQSTDELRQLIRDARTLGTPLSPKTDKSKGSHLSNPSNPPLSPVQATEILRDFDTTSNVVPIKVLRAVETLCTVNDRQGKAYLKRLDTCLHATQLAFTPPPPRAPETEERKKFRLRMEKLKLKQEESRYGGLVKNVGVQGQPDDVTTRSMTYAASIGLNMIVAPLSFGCFMYFFAGGIFDYFFSGEDFETKQGAGGATDIKRVIVGVVSGVIMMIIEMLLFVIRTHEFEEHSRKKKKKKGVEP